MSEIQGYIKFSELEIPFKHKAYRGISRIHLLVSSLYTEKINSIIGHIDDLYIDEYASSSDESYKNSYIKEIHTDTNIESYIEVIIVTNISNESRRDIVIKKLGL